MRTLTTAGLPLFAHSFVGQILLGVYPVKALFQGLGYVCEQGGRVVLSRGLQPGGGDRHNLKILQQMQSLICDGHKEAQSATMGSDLVRERLSLGSDD